jgi:amino acid transporter
MIYGALGLGALAIIPPLMGVVVGARDLARLSASPTPLQDFVREAGGPRMAAAISLGVAFAIFNAMIAIALMCGRILYAAARENSWGPGLNAALTKVHARYGSPWVATLVMGAASLALCFLPLSVLVLINGSGVAIGYGLLALGVIVGRRTGSTAKSQSRMLWHPVGPGIVILAALALLAAALADKSSGRPAAMVSLGVMAFGALYYQLFVRRAGAWSHHEPDEEQALASA